MFGAPPGRGHSRGVKARVVVKQQEQISPFAPGHGSRDLRGWKSLGKSLGPVSIHLSSLPDRIFSHLNIFPMMRHQPGWSSSRTSILVCFGLLCLWESTGYSTVIANPDELPASSATAADALTLDDFVVAFGTNAQHESLARSTRSWRKVRSLAQ